MSAKEDEAGAAFRQRLPRSRRLHAPTLTRPYRRRSAVFAGALAVILEAQQRREMDRDEHGATTRRRFRRTRAPAASWRWRRGLRNWKKPPKRARRTVAIDWTSSLPQAYATRVHRDCASPPAAGSPSKRRRSLAKIFPGLEVAM